MKTKKGQEASITQPVLKDLIAQHQTETKKTLESAVTIMNKPIEQPDLYQDQGGGYNADFVFPQE